MTSIGSGTDGDTIKRLGAVLFAPSVVRWQRPNGLRPLPSTADDGKTWSPFDGGKSVGPTPEDSASARDVNRPRGTPGDTGVDPDSGGNGAATTTDVPDDPEQCSNDQ